MASNVDIIVNATDNASKTLGGIGNSLNGIGALGKIAAASFAILASAVAGAGVALGYFAAAAAGAEESTARFNSMFDSSAVGVFTEDVTTYVKQLTKTINEETGKVTWGATWVAKTETITKGLDANFKTVAEGLAQSLSQVTRFEDENILEAEAMISLYQNIGQDIFPQVITTALDLAEVLKVDAAGGAETLGRALSDIAEGSLMMLARSRLITKEQQAMAEEMAKAGDEAGAQAYILEILDGKIGNLAETMGKTFTGSITIFKNNLGNIAEGLGAPLLTALAPVIATLNDFATMVAPSLQYAMNTIIVPAIDKMVAGFVAFVKSFTVRDIIDTVLTLERFFNGLMRGQIKFEDVMTSIGDRLRSIDWSAIRNSLTSIDWSVLSQKIIDGINAVDWNAIGLTVGEILKNVLAVGIDIAKEVNWSGLFTGLGKAFADFATGLGGGSMDEFIAVWTANILQVEQIALQIMGIIYGRVAEFVAAGKMIPSAIVAGMGAGWAVLLTWIAQRMNDISSVFNRAVMVMSMKVTDFIAIGQNIVTGLMTGIKNSWDAFENWFIGIVQDMIDAILATLGISSPSKLFAGIGKNMMLGLAEGIGDGVTVPINALTGLGPRFAMATTGGGSKMQSGPTNNHYYYGVRLLLERGAEGEILARLTE